MDTIFERLATRSRQEGRQEGFQEAEAKYQRLLQQERAEREALRQRGFAKQRGMILGALSHSFTLEDEVRTEIAEHLERIEDEDTLDRLINAALVAASKDVAFFMMQLIAESNATID